jgi:hypothetical protein
MTLPKIMLGVLIGGLGSFALTMDEMSYRDDELKSLTKQVQPLRVECPTGTVTVATKTQGQDWQVRCAGRGKVKAL